VEDVMEDEVEDVGRMMWGGGCGADDVGRMM
jgi:hypothetical protein